LTGTRLELFETGDIKIIIYHGVLKMFNKNSLIGLQFNDG